MAYTTTNWFHFADSQVDTGAAYFNKSLTNQLVDQKYHKEVQIKLFFKANGMIGPDTYNVGGPRGVYQTAPGYPVIRKTELSAAPGDTVKIGLRKNLSFAVSTGKIGNVQLLDGESTFDFNTAKVKVEQWRNGVATWGGINEQRNSYESFEQMEIDLCSDWAQQVEDTSILYALHYGWGPHIFRAYGYQTAPVTPTAIGNAYYGNDFSSGRTVADLVGGSGDNLKGQTFEFIDQAMREKNIEPVIVNGNPYWVAIVSPAGFNKLQRDSEFRNSWTYARERGVSNPLFNNSEGIVYNNVIIFRYDKVRTILAGKNPAGLTTTGSSLPYTIVEADYTGIGGGVTAAQLHQMYVMGANAVALAEGRFSMATRIRTENDYGNIIGRAVDNIFGTHRMDFVDEVGTGITNQSAILVVNTLT